MFHVIILTFSVITITLPVWATNEDEDKSLKTTQIKTLKISSSDGSSEEDDSNMEEVPLDETPLDKRQNHKKIKRSSGSCVIF